MTRSFVLGLGVVLFALGLACEDPARDLAEWTVADHTHQTEKPAGQRQRRQSTNKPAAYTPPSKKGNTLVEVTWVKQCSSCHGKRGRGDGPQSPMVKAKDLTAADWQSTVTDEQLMESIKKGKGKMPAFNLPDSMVAGLVAHIRTLPAKAQKGFPGNTNSVPPVTGSAAGAGAAPAAPAPAAARPAPAAPPAEEEDDEAEGDNAH